ncbi:MAG TPA: SUMF1/EgtB/PvdO family nonheme iron enzyme [Candidatus Hydrogenedentes bacterium]|nr:SUMF1/EgtB/PvdO family nonheme iron enzyme [Candidatus Hydrogenedentota bacterium]
MKVSRALLAVLISLQVILAVSGCRRSRTPTPRHRLLIALYPENGGRTDPPSGEWAYDAGTEVVVTATPAQGFEFDRWTLDGNDFGETRAAAVTIDADRTLTALFCSAVPDYTLSVSVVPAGGGETTPPEGSYAYRAGIKVFVGATASPGHRFVKWDIDGVEVSTEATVSVTMDSDVALTAVFEAIAKEYSLDISVEPPGAGQTTPAPGRHAYGEGTTVAISATAGPAHAFSKWLRDGVDFSTSPSGSVTVDEDTHLTALFRPLATSHYTLTLEVVPAGAGETIPPAGSYTYEAGTTVGVRAVAFDTYEFVRWNVADAEYSTDAETSVTLDADTHLTAVFEPIAEDALVLTIDVEPETGGTTLPPPGAHAYAAGTVVLLTAESSDGYAFTKWRVDGSEYSRESQTSFSILDDTYVTAVFESIVQHYTLTVDVNPPQGGTTSPPVGSHVYPEGTTVVLSASAATGFEFVGWKRNGGDFSSQSDISVTIDSDTYLTAVFESRATCTLRMAVFPANAGTTDPPVGEHVYNAGAEMAISAVAAFGHEFVKWTLDGADFSADASSMVTIDADMTLMAEFALRDDAGPIAVSFPDANLEAAIRKATRLPTGDICTTDLEKLEELYANYSLIGDLTGLEYCVNLHTLYLAGNAVVDLTSLKNTVPLTTLHLSHNEIRDTAPLKGLVNLTWLGLSYNELVDIAPLGNLRGLETLALSGNHIEAMTALSEVTALRKLYLSGNGIHDVSALQPLTELSRLYLDHTQVREIDALVENAGIHQDDYVDLRGSPLGPNALCAAIPVLEDRGVSVAYDGACGLEYVWRHAPHTDHYYTVTTPGTWQEVQAEALTLGGYLVAVNDAEENAWLLATFGEGERYWIGLSDIAEEGRWEWGNGDDVIYTNWAQGEPDASDPATNVAVLNVDAGGYWESASEDGVGIGLIERAGYHEGPSSAFSASVTSGIAPLIVHFEDQSVPGGDPITGWTWDFGDPDSGASNVSTDRNVRHVFNAAGTYTVTLTVTTSYGVDTSAREIIVAGGDEVALDDGVVFVDDHPSLFVDSLFRYSIQFTYTGNGHVDIHPGDVLVGTQEGGYLRRVLSVTQNGQLVVVTTEPASLVEVLKEAHLSHTIRFSGDDFAGAAKEQGTAVSLDGVLLGSEDSFLVALSGAIDFAPEVELEAQISHSSLEYFRAAAVGPFALDVDMVVSSAAGALASEETVLLTTQKTFEFMAGPIPVMGTADLSYEVHVAGEIDGETLLNAGFDTVNSIAFGGEYEFEDWRDIDEISLTFNGHAVVWEPIAGLDVAVSVIPKIEITFYDLNGPWMALTAFTDIQEQVEAFGVQREIAAGQSTSIDMEVGAIDSLVAGASWDAEGARQIIYAWSNEFPAPDLFVGAGSVTLTPSAPSVSVSVTNVGTGILSWTAFSNDPGVSVFPDSVLGNSAEATIEATDFSQSYSALVTFTNTEDDSDWEVVNVNVVGDIGPDEETPVAMVRVPGGWFEMGQREDESGTIHELPRHDVYLDSYDIGKYEVTNAAYARVLNWALANGYLENSAGEEYSGLDVFAFGERLLQILTSTCQIRFSDGQFIVESRDGVDMSDHPVVDVSWYGAAAFCNWLSEMNGLTPCYNLSDWHRISPLPEGFRLPTEAEWERAAAWGTKHWIYGFQSDTIDGARCNYDSANPLSLGTEPFTTEVGYFNGSNANTVDSSSPVGCYDMSGNAWEWCHDWYGDYTEETLINPAGPDSGSNRVVRGGSWYHSADNARTAFRPPYSPATTCSVVGFRVARSFREPSGDAPPGKSGL